MHTVESSVVAVTVYRRGALVTREAKVVAGEDGYPTDVQLVGLPLTLDDASLRVELRAQQGAAGEAPTAGDVRVTVAVPTADARLPPPKDDELEHARLEHATAERLLRDRRGALERLQHVRLDGRGRPEEGHAPKRSPTAARMGLLELRRRREATLHERIAEAVDQVEDTRQRLETLLERKRVASDSRNTRTFELRKAAVIRLESSDANPVPAIVLRLSYFVRGARWAPAYTVRLDDAMTSGSLEVRALVGQRTGENWRNVTLTLSTANPQHWTDLPELKAIRIGRAQPDPPRAGWRPPPVGADALYEDYDRDLARGPSRPAASRPPLSEAELLALVADEDEAFDGMEEQARAPRRRAAPKPAKAPPPPPPSAAPAPVAAAAPLYSAPGGPAMDMPMPQAAPALPAGPPMMLETRARKSAGLGNFVGGVLGGAAAGVAAGATALFRSSGGGGDDADAFAREESEGGADPGIVAGRDLLDYGSLQLAAPGASHRGKLRRVDSRILYERWAVERVAIDVIQIQIAEAERAAEALEQQAPPAGHHWAESEQGFDYAFLADAPVDIESAGRLTSIAVASQAAEVTPRYVSVPRETQDVFRIVAVRNPLEAPLLPGPADVYTAGKFALTSPVELTPPRGRVELGLGVEQAIKIARNIHFEEDTSGLIKRSHELVHKIQIDVSNHLERTATVEIRERVPTTREGDEDVTVEEREVVPPWEEYEQDRSPLEGGRAWKVEVPPGGERKLQATWVARIPSQHELVGGNRRER